MSADVNLDALGAMDRVARLARLRERFGEPGPLADCDSLLVSDPSSIRYLCGFDGSAGWLWIDTQRAWLLTDSRYAEQSRRQLWAAGVEDHLDIYVGNNASQHGRVGELASDVEHVAAEAHHLSWEQANRLGDLLAEHSSELAPTDGAIGELRANKDEAEVARIEAAAAIADEALGATAPALGGGCTEAEFARQLDYQMLNAGADALSFETICASGPNAALPHGRPSGRRIETGDLVIVDCGAMVDGYHSDMTRTFYVGPGEPTGAASVMLEAVTAAQQLGVDAVADGITCAAVDEACRSHLTAVGLGDEFTHGTGHGVGLDIHEQPWVGPKAETVLAQGNVITVEPGVYRHGFGGVRIEDTVLVTVDGARRLTRAPKHPTI